MVAISLLALNTASCRRITSYSVNFHVRHVQSCLSTLTMFPMALMFSGGEASAGMLTGIQGQPHRDGFLLGSAPTETSALAPASKGKRAVEEREPITIICSNCGCHAALDLGYTYEHNKYLQCAKCSGSGNGSRKQNHSVTRVFLARLSLDCQHV